MSDQSPGGPGQPWGQQPQQPYGGPQPPQQPQQGGQRWGQQSQQGGQQWGQPPAQPYGGPQPPQQPQQGGQQWGGPPTQGYVDPQQGGAPGQQWGGQPAYAAGSGQPTSHRGRRPIYIALVLVVALIAAGGTAFAYKKIGGGGAQPAEALPGNALTYARMDIDPSVGQKLAAVRFLDKLPKSKGDFTEGDLREKLWKAVQDDSPAMKDVNYEKDIKPWLGDRLGISVAPSPGDQSTPQVAVALQVKDEGKARDGIDKIIGAMDDPGTPMPSSGSSAPLPRGLLAKAGGNDKPAYFFHGDYAVFTTPDQLDAVKKSVNDSPLSDNETFKKDMADLGEQGILSAWGDMGKLFTEIQPAAKGALGRSGKSDANLDQLKKAGRAAVALRFDKNYLEFAGITRGQSGLKKTTDRKDSQIGQLPADTAVAMSVSGGDQLVGNAWDKVMGTLKDQRMSSSPQEQIDKIKQEYGISLPDDLKTLLGSNLAIGAPDQDLKNTSGPQDVKVGARITTDSAQAETVIGKLQKVVEDQGGDFPIVHKADGDQFFLATQQDYLDTVSKKGDLGDSEAFKLAVPEAADSDGAVYVDLDKLEHHYMGSVPADSKEFVKAFRSVGAATRVTGDGEAAFTFRLVSN